MKGVKRELVLLLLVLVACSCGTRLLLHLRNYRWVFSCPCRPPQLVYFPPGTEPSQSYWIKPLVLTDDNLQGRREYERFYRSINRDSLIATRKATNQFYQEVVSGRLASGEELEGRAHELKQRLDESVDNWEMHAVPRDYLKGHKLGEFSHRSFYDLLEQLQAGSKLSGPEQQEAYQAAQRSLKAGWTYSNKAQNFLDAAISKSEKTAKVSSPK